MKALLVTLDRTLEWRYHEKELEVIEDGKEYMNFRIPYRLTSDEGITKVYLVYRDNIIGWLKYLDYRLLTFNPKAVDNHNWSGYFIQMTGPFQRIEPIPFKDFMGYKYIDDETFKEY